jgi:galactokinase
VVSVLGCSPEEVIGEHTDYNYGLALPTPIAESCIIAIAPRSDNQIQIHSQELQESLRYELGQEKHTGNWIDYPQSVTQTLSEAGYDLKGFDACVSSNIPLGAGLSSSAAMLVAMLKALREMLVLPIGDFQVAKLAQKAENGLVGANVGLMDQLVCALGENGFALKIDFNSLSTKKILLPKHARFLVINSGLKHQLAHDSGDRNYKTRRAECEQALEILKVNSLGELSLNDLISTNQLPQPLDARVRHVITENARVKEATKALKAGDLSMLGFLFNMSHTSMRYHYDVSTPEIDVLVEIAQATRGVFGARLTGGGFGGSIVILADAAIEVDTASIIHRYHQKTGKDATLLSSC